MFGGLRHSKDVEMPESLKYGSNIIFNKYTLNTSYKRPDLNGNRKKI